MADQINVSWPYPATDKNLQVQIPILDWNDFVVTVDEPGDCELSNGSAPLDQPELVRIKSETISNVYTNTGIDPSAWATSRRGKSIVAGLSETIRITKADDPLFRIDLPLKCHTVLRVPTVNWLTTNMIAELLRRNFALWGTDQQVSEGQNPNARLDAILRGALNPHDN